MSLPSDRVRLAFEGKVQGRIPRGEVWVCSDVLGWSGLEDDLAGHLALRKNLGMDLIFLPVSRTLKTSTQGYRYFGLDDVERAVRESDLFVGVVIDGPFQRLAERKGLMPLLTSWALDRAAAVRELAAEAADAADLIAACVRLKLGAVVIADDLAGEENIYLHPDQFSETLGPFYKEAAALIKADGARALFHSCGNFFKLLPLLGACGFDGLAAVQGRRLDLPSVKDEYGFTLLAGIEAQHLQADLTLAGSEALCAGLTILARGGGMILGSSCGLYSGDFADRLLRLYRLAEEIFS